MKKRRRMRKRNHLERRRKVHDLTFHTSSYYLPFRVGGNRIRVPSVVVIRPLPQFCTHLCARVAGLVVSLPP